MEVLKKLSIKAIFLAFLVTMIIDVSQNVVIVLSIEELLKIPMSDLDNYGRPTIMYFIVIFLTFLGTFCAYFVGGYIAARIAKSNEMLNALAFGIFATMLLITWTYFDSSPPTLRLPYWLIFVPAALLGGYKRKKVSVEKRQLEEAV